ncbi:MAG TPA: GGDEF domain-containing protein [Terracidiphilus sp.]|jgi:diguanylate cyclase (GGDEF)-like protein|nr:GGDEF domain-containing protein [Terracidiphilus sp.]
MAYLIPALLPTEPDSSTLDNLARIERIVLAAVVLLAALNLLGRLALATGLHFAAGWAPMSSESALAALLCALSLEFSIPRHSTRVRRLSMMLAAVAALLASAVVCEYVFHFSLGIDLPGAAGHGLFSLFAARMSLPTAAGFAGLAIALLVIPARGQLGSAIADLLVFLLVLGVLILVSGHMLAVFHVFNPASTAPTSSHSMIVLLMLTAVAFLRKAENGVYSILLGRGTGSNIARGLSPVLLLLPYLREATRAHFIISTRMPPHYTTAILASLAVMLSFALLLFLAWRINRMEREIHDLSLRDELTDLYNLRGFRLLAEQALRMARRSNLAFSVLFIDLDNLKHTNDTLGHQAGSDFLVETARILKSSFREADVVGRIGGDEFAVAGQFNKTAIELAARRIDESVARRNAENKGGPALSLSIGHVTSDLAPQDTLTDLLARADQSMYEAKRSKKTLVK